MAEALPAREGGAISFRNRCGVAELARAARAMAPLNKYLVRRDEKLQLLY